MEIIGKSVLVTGGANGIGRDLVFALRDAGARVGVLDVKQESLDRLGQECSEVWCHLCDISDPDQVERSVAAFADHFGVIDALVNNAGFIYSAPLLGIGKGGFRKHDLASWKKVIDIDLNGVFYVTLNVVEKMVLKRTRGVVINVSSICASGNAGQGAYSAAKAGVNALTVAWAKELGAMRIRVVGVAPGFVGTETTKNAMEEAVLGGWIKQTPLRRLGIPKEIAETILFAIRNDFISGRILEIDGGLRL